MESTGGGGADGGGHAMLYKMGLEYLQSAKNFETTGKIQQAYKFYREAANKFMFLLKSEEGNSVKTNELKELFDKAVDSGLWVKQQIDDQKAKMRVTSSTKSKGGDLVLGLRLCGQNYMEAYKFYWDLGEYFFGLVTKSKGILPAAKNCYIIAAENLNAVS